MHSIQRLAEPFTRKILLLAEVGLVTLALSTLSVLVPFLHTSQNVQASHTQLHPFTITSPDFRDGEPLSVRNEANRGTCTGGNVAPKLNWKNAPAGTQSFVLLLIDNDAAVAGGNHHWVDYNIPASAHQLVGNLAFTPGTNQIGGLGYTGPCPHPTGETHHYQFLLYAINLPSIGQQGLTYAAVIGIIQGHVLGATSIIGTFHLPL